MQGHHQKFSSRKSDPNWTKLKSENIEAPKTPIEWIAFNAAVNSTAHLEEKEGKIVSIGNSTEGALLIWLKENKKIMQRLGPKLCHA